jgi:hypothetical protein
VSGNYLVAGTTADQWRANFAKYLPGVTVVMSQEGKDATGEVEIETEPRMNDRLREASEFEDRLKRSVVEGGRRGRIKCRWGVRDS